MNKTALMKKIAFSIEWNWLLVRCWDRAIHILWRRKLIKKTPLIREISQRMVKSRQKARELQSIYNVLYFNQY